LRPEGDWIATLKRPFMSGPWIATVTSIGAASVIIGAGCTLPTPPAYPGMLAFGKDVAAGRGDHSRLLIGIEHHLAAGQLCQQVVAAVPNLPGIRPL
jgi:hypothetical protein